MVKTINITFDDEIYEKILEKRGDRTWREFLIESLFGKEKKK